MEQEDITGRWRRYWSRQTEKADIGAGINSGQTDQEIERNWDLDSQDAHNSEQVGRQADRRHQKKNEETDIRRRTG